MRSLRGSVVFSPMSRLCSFGDGFTVAHGWGCPATFVITKIWVGACLGWVSRGVSLDLLGGIR